MCIDYTDGFKPRGSEGFAHLFSSVAVFLLQVPLERHVRRPGLALQERGAALHPILHRLQSVLIG